MIKRFVILFAVALASLNCASAFAQEEQQKPEYYVGLFTLDEILQHDEQYADIAFTYVPDEEALAVFKAVAEPVTIKLFYRTNCPDSVREVPPFIKTIQLADNPDITVEAVGVDRAKAEPADLVAGWDIQRVPTFIVVRDGQEVGRVIETSRVKIEVDLAEFLRPMVK